ncbi:type I-F CRISPR-associated endoribonuclease Cas6/Csy4 [Pseudoalteromonas denitrificans]|uniref:CRISPR-associated protein, Csy4 family n=1 Tax=Pseudoalteromonas denitrificans DSM 6059 TaxID=1123010 RepID=A0A1I1TU20_9GAMM|nr:type I-F CRISPR-associated endoribonuclease Cas6/Csy4 [Pseudoalteromonas denitrificans]SFD62176.1 CRISPR-associated protein, Csy4 family [Pseudoalteromonas denitrificans DSM 6059]
MDYYFDIKIVPTTELRENVLLNKVYAQLHKALGRLTSDAIGVSFPDYNLLLGKTLRLHGNEAMLNDLQGLNWLGELSTNCKISAIKPVPNNVMYRTVSRKQSNMTQSKLNRLIKRGSISPDEVKAYKAKMFTKGLDNPYLELTSDCNGHFHRRYFQFGDLLEKPVAGQFDLFGLSKQATVPWF